jgi:hypothetical protein
MKSPVVSRCRIPAASSRFLVWAAPLLAMAEFSACCAAAISSSREVSTFGEVCARSVEGAQKRTLPMTAAAMVYPVKLIRRSGLRFNMNLLS